MPRYPHQGTTKDGSGKLICSATVAVFLTGTATPANIYAASAGGVAVNSVTSGADTSSAPGYFVFWVDRSDYAFSQLFDITISKSGFNTQTYSSIDVGVTSHKTTHQDGGADEISLTDLSGAPSECVLLAGRVGGQIVYGGTGSGDDLTLYSTSHATKGYIRTTDKVELNNLGTWVSDARALLYVIKDVGLASGEIDYTASIATKSKGDNATYIGSSALQLLAFDRDDVTALNKGVLYGLTISTHLHAARNNVPFDDAACLMLLGLGDFKGTDCLYIGKCPTMATSEWGTGINIECLADQAIALKGTFDYGVSIDYATLNAVGGKYHAITIPNNSEIFGKDSGGTYYQSLILLSATDNVGLANGLPTGKFVTLAHSAVDANVVYIHVAGADALITAGADDSGGAGYKVLRVPN
jgi:hypothetical protein